MWVEPGWWSEVEYTERTDEGLLRQPVFLRFRDDKRPEECVRGGGRREDGATRWRRAGRRGSIDDGRRGAAVASSVTARSGAGYPMRRRPRHGRDELPFELTNIKKIFWPEDGYTKGDLLAYYRAIAPWLLPYLRDRPLVMTRYPDGIGGKSFFQKDAPGFAPDWIRTERMWSEDTQREIDYFVCDDVASLLYVINLGLIPIHLWASRVPTLERPDWCVLDLDPKGAPFEHVVEVALGSQGAVRPDRPAGDDQEHRLFRPAPDDPARPAVHPRAVPLAGRAAGPLHRRPAARDRHHHASGEPARREGLRGLPAERLGQADRLALLCASAAGSAGVGAAGLARGEPESSTSGGTPSDRARADAEARSRSAGPGARAGPDLGAALERSCGSWPNDCHGEPLEIQVGERIGRVSGLLLRPPEPGRDTSWRTGPVPA